MPAYPSADALLTDVLLRLDRFGPGFGALVVEGPDDKRFLIDKTYHRQQIVVAGGRGLLLASHARAAEKGHKQLAFLIDCDYDVRLKLISPAPNLIVTEHADLEADLLFAAGWERLVSDLLPAALEDDDRLHEIVYAVLNRTVALADILGRYRIVARKLAFRAETSIRHRRYRSAGSSDVDEPRLIRTLWQNSTDCPISEDNLSEQMSMISADYDNCNGHDLINALNHVLREDFGVRDQSSDHLATQLRLGVSSDAFDSLRITRRLRKWEIANSLKLLRNRAN